MCTGNHELPLHTYRNAKPAKTTLKLKRRFHLDLESLQAVCDLAYCTHLSCADYRMRITACPHWNIFIPVRLTQPAQIARSASENENAVRASGA